MSPGMNAGAPGDTGGRGTAGELQDVQQLHPTSGFSGNQGPIYWVRNRLARWIAPPDQVFSKDLSLLLDQLSQYQDGEDKQLEVIGRAASMCRKASELHETISEAEMDWLKASAHRDFAHECRELLFTLQNEVARLYAIRAKARAA